MTDTSKSPTCQIVCWSLSGLAGLVIAIGVSGPLPILLGVVVGIVLMAVMGLVLQRAVCGEALDHWGPFEGLKGVPGWDSDPDPDSDIRDMTDKASKAEPAPEPEAKPAAADDPAAEPATDDPDTATAPNSTLLPGEEELAAKKGSWRYDSANS